MVEVICTNLISEPSDDPPRAVVASEAHLSERQTPLLVFESGEVQLYNDARRSNSPIPSNVIVHLC